jgi:hypothetical protein
MTDRWILNKSHITKASIRRRSGEGARNRIAKRGKRDKKQEFTINPHEGATIQGRDARPSSLTANGGAGSSKIFGTAVKVGEARGYGTPVKNARPRHTE